MPEHCKIPVTQLAVIESITYLKKEDLRLGKVAKTPEWYIEGVKKMREKMIEALKQHAMVTLKNTK